MCIRDSTKAARWLQDAVLPIKRRIADTFRPRIQQAHELHKGLVADERRFLAPVEGAERVVRGKLAEYEELQRRRQREVEEAIEKQDQETADRIIAAPLEVPPVVPRPVFVPPPAVVTAPKVEGLSFREEWDLSLIH